MTLLAVTALVSPCLAGQQRGSEKWCLFLRDDFQASPMTPLEELRWRARERNRGEEGEDEADEDAMAPKIPTKRTPFAYEVGPPPGAAVQSISPLPGLPLDTSFDNVSWVPQGPGLTQDGDLNIAPMHPTAGCVTAIAPHPTNQNVIYIGTANGGVWRTDNALDANVRWKPLTDDQLSLSIGGLAIDPTDATGNTLVAGIGRRSSYGGSGGALKGILRTTDGGATWTRLGEVDLAGRNVYQLAARGGTIIVCVPNTDNATAPGLYRSKTAAQLSRTCRGRVELVYRRVR